MITEGIEKKSVEEIKDDLVIECMNHIEFAKSKLSAFAGREQFMADIKQRVLNDEDDKG